MAELEIDDIAFLTGESRSHQNSCEGCLCGPSTRRRCSKSPHGLAALLACPGSSNSSRRSAILVFTSLSSLLALILLIALLVAFANPFSGRCLESDLAEGPHVQATSDAHGQTSALPALATTGETFPWQDIRLPKLVQPLHYDLFMHPNLTTFVNKGSVEIVLAVIQETTFIVLHAKDLNITAISVSEQDNVVIDVKRHLLCATSEQLYIELDQPLHPFLTNYSLKISFVKKLEERLEGFYISSYHDSGSDRKRFIATTHFEPTSARAAFPCFDEPAFKASYALKMVHEPHHDVYFNSDRQTKLIYNPDGLFLSVFDETVRMSSYLVAFTVCDFKTMSARTKDGIHVRVLVPSDQQNQAEYALFSATALLTYFQDFFNITYPLSKLDLMAVPDFAAGAMENWGLITFRTTMILFQESESSNEVQEQVAVVIAHELGHQWFGNLVTMKWWSDLWLNEGFASFIENLGVNFMHPEWRMLDQFVGSTTQEAMALDSLESSHPIRAQVTNPAEIEAIFDAISYKKGAALIRMLEGFLKFDVLRAGLSRYLHKYQYRNAETNDLWQCFSEAVPNSSLNVTAIMDRWVKQKGFPVIATKLERNRLYLSQRRFLSSLSEEDSTDTSDISPFGYQWIVPITIITNKNPSVPKLVWLSSPDAVLSMDPTIDWFKLNTNQSGFYRVNYDESNWRRLIELLHSRDFNRHVLTPTDRAGLLDDAFSLMKISLLTADLAMNLSNYLETGERDFVPWDTALRHFAALDAVMDGNPYLRKYILKVLQPSLTVFLWKDEGPHLTRKLRSAILKAAVKYGDEATTKVARRFFEEWMRNSYRVAPNFREVVYTSGVRFGTTREWDFCWKKYKASKIPSEQRLLLTALGSSRDPWLLQKLLRLSLEKDNIKPQDTVQVIVDVARNPAGKLLVWRFVRENWDKILTLFGQGSFSMEFIISETSWHFSREFDYQEVSEFYKVVHVGSGSQAVAQTLERIRANIYWKTHIEEHVVKWLQKVTYRL